MVFSHRFTEPVHVVAVVAAVAGFSAGVLSLFVANPYPRVIGSFVFSGVLGWAALQARETSIKQLQSVEQLQFDTGLFLGVYLLWLAATVLTYVSAGYERTLLVHAALVGLFVLAVATVVVTASNTVRLAVVVATGVVHRGLVYYASSLQIGNDAVWHTRIASEIVASGTLEPLAASGSKYWYMPLHHLLVAGVSSVTQLPVRHAAFLAVTVPLVVVPSLAIYALLAEFNQSTIGVIAAWLYLAADRAVGQSVHVIPTSTGVLFTAVILLGVVGYLYRGHRFYVAVVLGGMITQAFTHPVSLFVTFVVVVSLVGGRAILRQSVGTREAGVALVSTSVVFAQFSLVRYAGRGSQESLLTRILANLRTSLAEGPRGETSLPSSTDFVVASSDQVPSIELVGIGFLFGLGVLGALVWLSETDRFRRELAFALGTTVAAMSGAIFAPPIIGINFLFPYRWFSYLYIPLVMLAAVGIAALASSLGRRQATLAAVVIVVIAAPYTAVMAVNSSGSLEDPVIDDSPTAQRLGATPTEAAMYSFVATYGGGERVIADRIAVNYLERGATYPAATFAINYSTGESIFTDERLVVDRAYAHTKHASYYVHYEDRWYTVFGPVPADRAALANDHSVVYSAGDERVVYVAGNES